MKIRLSQDGTCSQKFQIQNKQVNHINLIHIHDKKVECIILSDSSETVVFKEYLDYYSLKEIENAIPESFLPQIIIFWHPEYYFVPVGIESSDAFTVACVGDWNLNFVHLSKSISRFDLIITDFRGKNTFEKLGLKNVEYFPLFSMTHPNSVYSIPGNLDKEYDIIFIGNLNQDVQVERSMYLYRIAMLAEKYKVFIATRVYGPEYFEMYAKSKIIFNRSIRGELNIRVFEAFITKSLLFLEEGNEEFSFYLKDRQELVLYNDDNIEELIEYYLSNDFERERIVNNAFNFIQNNNQDTFRKEFLKKIIHFFEKRSSINVKRNRLSENEKNLVSHEEALITLDSNIYSRISNNFFDNSYFGKIIEENSDFIPENNNDILYSYFIQKIYNNYSLHLYKHNSLELVAFLEKAIEKFPLNFILRLNYLSIIRENDKLKAKNLIYESVRILENGKLNTSDFEGIFFNERYSRFHSEYERIFYSSSENELTGKLKSLFLWRFYLILGEILFEEGESLQSLDFFINAEKIFTTVYIEGRIGEIYVQKGDIVQAYRHYTEGFRLNPFDLNNLYTLICLEIATDFTLEIPEKRDWLTIIESSPIFNEYRKNIINLKEENIKRKFALAKNTSETGYRITLLNKILSIDSNNSDAIFLLGKTFHEMREYSKAINLYSQLLRTDKNKEVIPFLADSLKEIGDYKTFEKLLKTDLKDS